ncbi:DUF4433 domain-containing protein [Sesbania bispinosa]|nr:DUF4433 domain-containing protein [Sesbania bispinosa]
MTHIMPIATRQRRARTNKCGGLDSDKNTGCRDWVGWCAVVRKLPIAVAYGGAGSHTVAGRWCRVGCQLQNGSVTHSFTEMVLADKVPMMKFVSRRSYRNVTIVTASNVQGSIVGVSQ